VGAHAALAHNQGEQVKIFRMRLLKGCYAFKGVDIVQAGPDTSIELTKVGHFLVTRKNQTNVLVPHSQVHFAECEAETDAPKSK
jgi:hypothetical protein